MNFLFSFCFRGLMYHGSQLGSLVLKIRPSPSTVSHSVVGPRIREQLGNGEKRERARFGLGSKPLRVQSSGAVYHAKKLSLNLEANF